MPTRRQKGNFVAAASARCGRRNTSRLMPYSAVKLNFDSTARGTALQSTSPRATERDTGSTFIAHEPTSIGGMMRPFSTR